MAKVPLPTGYRFHPTDEELVMCYLKRKVMGRRLPSEAVSEIKLYEYAPWEFPEMSESKDLEWFFFCSPHRKYKTGRRVDRVAKSGYWKTTGKDKPIRVVVNGSSQVVGKRRTFVFHEGKAPKGDRTNWVMHEYRLEDKTLAEADASICQDRFVVCKIFEKSGRGPKNGEQYGAPFVEEDDDDSDDDGSDNVSGLSMTHPVSIPSTSSLIPEEGHDAAMISSTLDSGDGQDSTFPLHFEAHVVSSPEHDVDGDTSNGNDVQQADSIVANKTTIDEADTPVSLKWPEELNSVDWEDQNWLRQMLLSSIGEGCFIEMNDIDVKEPTKVEGHQACVSDLGLFANVLGSHSTPVLPASKVNESKFC